MIWNGEWTIDKEDTVKEILEVEPGASSLDSRCWTFEEEVEAFPGAGYYTHEFTNAVFTKLVVPESVTEIKGKALYKCETVKEISPLLNVISIGKEAFKGCIGLSNVVAPLIKVSQLEDADTKMKLAFGYCLNERLYSAEIAEDYLKYLKSQKTKVLQVADKFSMPEIEDFLISKGIISDGNSGKKNVKKLNAVDSVLLLERTVLTGTYDEIEYVIKTYQPFETMARALGLASRCRTKDIVELLVKNKASFKFDSKIASKYGFNCKQSSKTVKAEFQMLICANNVWNKYLFGSFDKHYKKENSVTEYSEIVKSYLDFSEVPSDMTMAPISERIENINYLLSKQLLKQEDINNLLYHSILEKDYEMADLLEQIGAVVNVAWLVSDADHTSTISELNQYLDVLSRLNKKEQIKAIDRYASSLEKGKKQMYINDNIWNILEASKYGEMARALLKNGDVSSINKTRFLKYEIATISIDSLAALLDKGFVTSIKLRDELIEIATTKRLTEVAALLIDYKNRTADLLKEEANKEKKLLKELTAAPDSAYELKKNWITKKKEDGTLIITAYKGEDTEVTVPSKVGKAVVTEIGKEAFSPDAMRITNQKVRRKITKIIIPDTVTTIGSSAFAKCSKLSEIIMPDSITTFGSRVFLGCSSLKEISLPPKTKGVIRWYFFGDCTSLQKIYIPNGVTAITEWSFIDCSALKEIHLKKGTTNFDYSSLEDCKKATVYAPEGSCAHQFAIENGLKFISE